jgi:dihydrolipoamide dehydrogenase
LELVEIGIYGGVYMYDVAVIGGGPGGYVAAIRAAQLNGKVAIVEKENLGGVCLNRGCIPTKTLLKSAEKWQELQHCADFGLRADNIGFDFSRVMERKNRVVGQLQKGIIQLLESNGIDIFYGIGTLMGNGKIDVQEHEGANVVIEARNIIIATGSIPAQLSIPGTELPGVLDSDGVLALTEVPHSMLVIGSGAVGIEFAVIYQAFGCDVTVVEMLPAILPKVDGDLVKRMGLILRKQGLKILTGTKTLRMEKVRGGISVLLDNGKNMQELVVEKVLVAVGRRPVLQELGLEQAGVVYNAQGIPVNMRMETNVPGIYAVGDVTGQYKWAHVAYAEGLAAAENAMGGNAAMDYLAVPGCIFTTPEIAMAGLSEEEAKEQRREIRVGKCNFAANGKAVSMGDTEGLVKVIADAGSGRIIGMHILGPHASDLIMEGAIAIRNGLKAQNLAHAIHPHPSLSETVMEAVHDICGAMIHQVKMRQ